MNRPPVAIGRTFLRPRRFTEIGLALAMAGIMLMTFWNNALPADKTPYNSVALAVIGDSNSHSFHDEISFPPGTPERGGSMRARTFQWTEVLARLRGNQINSGPWLIWGRRATLSWLREAVGLRGDRSPRKEDYLYNFAYSGAVCANLIGGRFERSRQVPRLVALMDADPERWRNGVVVIRMGFNDWAALLDLQAENPDDPRLEKAAAFCLDQIAASIRMIHARHPDTNIIIVGILNEADDPVQFEKYRSAEATANIRNGLDRFNDKLRALPGGNPRLTFFDDAAWFRERWGERASDGSPDYKTVTVGSLRVTNTAGDEPNNAILADSHAGLVFNTLWAQSLVARLRDAFGLPLTPISDEEVERFIANP